MCLTQIAEIEQSRNIGISNSLEVKLAASLVETITPAANGKHRRGVELMYMEIIDLKQVIVVVIIIIIHWERIAAIKRSGIYGLICDTFHRQAVPQSQEGTSQEVEAEACTRAWERIAAT